MFCKAVTVQGDNGDLRTISANVYFNLRKKGVVSRPHHPKQNGMHERAFRTIDELVMSILVHVGLVLPCKGP